MNDSCWEALAREARAHCAGADPAHDFAHVLRVVQNAKIIATEERADVTIATTAALLHELFNYPKNHPESHLSGDVCATHAATLLREQGADAAFTDAVASAIRTHAFSRGLAPTALEGKVLQDADRLDAIGAIGVARCFATAGTMRVPFYSQEDPFCRERAPDDKAFGVDHFFVKLLKIPATLHTPAARRMAEDRAVFLRTFLNQLGAEIGR